MILIGLGMAALSVVYAAVYVVLLAVMIREWPPLGIAMTVFTWWVVRWSVRVGRTWWRSYVDAVTRG